MTQKEPANDFARPRQHWNCEITTDQPPSGGCLPRVLGLLRDICKAQHALAAKRGIDSRPTAWQPHFRKGLARQVRWRVQTGRLGSGAILVVAECGDGRAA